jgi:glucose/arabinose dehydrogenase
MQRGKGILLLALVSFLASACGGGGGTVAIGPPDGQPPPPDEIPQITTQRVFEQLSFNQPVALLQAPGDSGRWFVVEQSGVVRVFDNDPSTSNSSVFVDITDRVASGGETGLLGIAFHPSFPGTPEAYLSYTARSGNQLISRISRFSTGDGGATLNKDPEDILLTVLQPQDNHNGGDLVFGQDGFLYASLGDGGGGGDPGENAQNTANLLGSILRIDIDGNSLYNIPVDNPFASINLCVQGFSGGDPCPEIYAYGLRNPWRISIDSATGDLWLGDVGQSAWEEIDRVAVGQSPMERNYGWDDREGAHPFETESGCATTTCIDPVTEYGRSLGGSITGGYVYRGSAIPDLAGWYVFGDFSSGRIFAVPEVSQPTVEPEELLDTALSISTFAEGVDGELYVLDYGLGTIHKVQPAP